MNLYAIRIGDWIEIRSSSKPPLKVRSIAKLEGRIKERNPETGRMRLVKGEKKLECVRFNGGSVLGVMKFNQFVVATRSYFKGDEAFCIPEKFHPIIRKGLEL